MWHGSHVYLRTQTMETLISIPALNLEFDTLRLWLERLQVIHADAEQNPRVRAAAKNLQALIRKRMEIVRNRIEHATLLLRIPLSERAIQRTCELLESEGAPEKLLKAIRTLFDSLWVSVLRKNQRQKALKIKRLEHNAARHSDSFQRYLKILGLENEPYLKVDYPETHHTVELDGDKKPHNFKSDSKIESGSKPKHHSKSRAGAPASPQNLFFYEWIQRTAESDQNVHSFSAEADRVGLKLPRRTKLDGFTTWKKAKLEEPETVKKWYNDANRAMKARAKRK